MRLLGGIGQMNGRVVLTLEAMTIELDLASDQAKLRYQDYQATTDMLLQLRAGITGAAAADGAVLDMSGTRLRLDNAAAAAATRVRHVKAPVPSKPWKAELEITDGKLSLPLPPPAQATRGPIRSMAHALAEQGFGTLLATANGRLLATLTLSRLDWIAEFLNRPLNLSFNSAAKIDAEILLADGMPVSGTSLQIPPDHA